jgi:excisionase family DNA binding protein
MTDSSLTTAVLLNVEEARARLRIGRTMLYRLIDAGDIRPVKIGNKTLIPIAEVERLAREGAVLPRTNAR